MSKTKLYLTAFNGMQQFSQDRRRISCSPASIIFHLNEEVARELDKVRELIRTEIPEMSLSELASEANLSPFHFHRLYRSRFGETPLQTLNDARLKAAIAELRRTKTPINEVCSKLGFWSVSTFTSWFYKRAGCTPSAFRRLSKKAQEARIKSSYDCEKISIAVKAKITHVTVYVKDQESALKFYTEKLGFELAFDLTLPEGFRWLTVAPTAGDVELVLFPIGASVGMSDELTAAIETTMASGYCGPCVFTVPDCAALHAELVSRGVTVQRKPHEEVYGIEASYLDDSGNVLTFCQA